MEWPGQIRKTSVLRFNLLHFENHHIYAVKNYKKLCCEGDYSIYIKWNQPAFTLTHSSVRRKMSGKSMDFYFGTLKYILTLHEAPHALWLVEKNGSKTYTSKDVLCEFLESVCYIGFGVYSPFPLISLFELSSTCSPWILASLAVFKTLRKMKADYAISTLWDLYIYVQLMCFIFILYC